MLPPRQSTFRRRAVLRAGIAVAAVAAAALVAFTVAARVARIDDASLRPATPPAATTPSPSSPPLADVGRAALSRVVTIEALLPSEEALGTGWLLDARGDFVTNAHVVTGHLSVRITDRQAHVHVATVIGSDPEIDIAIVRAADGFNQPPLPLDHVALTALPQAVIALASSRATGHVDLTPLTVTELGQDVPLSTGRETPAPGAPSVYHDMLHLTGEKVFQGNSGGPVLDATGTVVGIITLADPTRPDSFAIPITRVAAELASLAARSG